jgi:DNA-binding response OmpR family regulator
MVLMTTTAERILLVEHDPEKINLISRQVLQPLGYHVDGVPDAGSAIQQVLKFTPDLIICDLNLQGLSSMDLLMAMRSQGLQVPMIVIAEKGQELDVIHAFRVGAKDFLLWPARDAEVVSVVDMWVHQVRDDQTSQILEQNQKKTIQELQQRVHELTTVIAIGREILVTRDRPSLLEKLVESAVYLGKSNYGLLMLLNGSTNDFELASSWNLPEGWSSSNWKKWSDWMNASVVISGKTFLIQESQLKQLEMDSLGRSAVVVPIKLDQKVIGSFLLVREMDVPFEKDKQTFLKVLADYASISLANVS